jgi:hypothetical protein
MGGSWVRKAHYGQLWVVAGLVAGLKGLIMDRYRLCSKCGL